MITHQNLQLWRCTNEFWSYDDMDPCHRQLYLEFYLVALFLGAALLYSVWRIFTSRNSISKQPEENSLIVFHPENAGDPTAQIKLRTRSINDRLRVLAETVLNAATVIITTFLVTDDNFVTRFAFAPHAPTLLISLVVYNTILSIYRLIHCRQITSLCVRPYHQQCFLYPLALTIYSVNWYSQLIHPYSAKIEKLFAIGTAVTFANWMILYSSPIGDSLPRLYVCQNKARNIKGFSEPSTEPYSSLFDIMMCQWSLPLLKKAWKKRLDFEDTLDLSEENHSYIFMEKFNRLPESWGFTLRIVYVMKVPILLTTFYGCVSSLLRLTPTLFIQKILEYLEDSSVPKSVGWLYVFMLGFCYTLQNIAYNQSLYQGRRLCVGIRALLICMIYRKTLFRQVSQTKSGSADSEQSSIKTDQDDGEGEFDPTNSGTIVNLLSIDTFKISDFSAYLSDITATPPLLILALLFLYNILGWSAFVAFGIMVSFLPINFFIGLKLNSAQIQLLNATDLRIEKTKEILDAIRIVKYYTWERRLSDKVLKIRDEELSKLMWHNFWLIMNDLTLLILPVLVTITSFWCYIRLQGEKLTTSVAFTALSIFSILHFPLNSLGQTISEASSAYVSISRITQYLSSADTSKYQQLKEKGSNNDEFIGFENATLSWFGKNASSEENNFKLRNIDLKFALEDLNVIIGPTGSGKTSLLLALLGEMDIEGGSVYLPGSNRRNMVEDPNTGLKNAVAYVPQEAWLLNDTIRNNIIFGNKFDIIRYNEVLDVCQLRRDLRILSGGDQTLIGDKGIALSGGQKQRVSLARALYSNSRHLILDDCLSAVDSHTSEALYYNALIGPLAKNRTVILVSHNVSLTIGHAANIVVMENGRIAAKGTPAEVYSTGLLGDDELINKNAQLASQSRIANQAQVIEDLKMSRISSYSTLNESNDRQSGPTYRGIDSNESAMCEEDAVLAEEERAEGSIPLSVYLGVVKQMGGVKFAIILIGLVLLTSYVDYLLSWWVKLWASKGVSNDNNGTMRALFLLTKGHILPSVTRTSISSVEEPDRDSLANLHYYGTGYLLIGLLMFVLGTFRDLFLYYGCIRASKIIFQELLLRVVRAHTKFFDTTPSGRIVNRFSHDIVTVDQEMGTNFLIFVMAIMDTIRVAIVVSWVTPLLIPFGLIVVIMFFLISRTYLITARELKRLESVTKSPIFQQFGETMSGAVVIRAYGDTDRFIEKNLQLVDDTHRPFFWLWSVNRWLAFWCSSLSIVICVFAAAIIVQNANSIDPGMAGISFSLTALFGDAIIWVVRMYAQCEIDMNSVQRLYEYMGIEQEAPEVIPESRPPRNWPSRGNVEFKNLSLQYSENLPMVIKNVSFKVCAGKKVGIVGRTGAGKSTIIKAMFRMLEPVTGTVLIDDVDITTIGLRDLRSVLSIIPQDPTLFKGTLRSNLDLFSEYDDNKLFRALSYVNLVPEGATTDFAAAELAKADSSENVNQFLNLETEVSEGGQNFSQGQRQLICLARAILKNPKILLLDEATASIDYETDTIIQKTIREKFSQSTIITIAHRLRTIADYDFILVLSEGMVAEFAHPYELLQNRSGIFYSMCEKSGELDTLYELAKTGKNSAVS